MGGRAALGWQVGAVVCLTLLSACGGSDADTVEDAARAIPPESLIATLAYASGDAPYVVDTVPTRGGQIAGQVQFAGDFPRDTLTRPTHDLSICKPRPDAPMEGDSDAVGQAVVWLVGVEHGPADNASKRVSLSLSDCALEPRVQRAPVGAILMVRSDDDMDARLRFLTATEGAAVGSSVIATPDTLRALMSLSTSGAVVPNTEILAQSGLVEVRDDRHPWVRGWIAVAPHPFVVITGRDGRFSFASVPPGAYVLVVWHERLGRVALAVHVDVGVDTRVTVTFPKPE